MWKTILKRLFAGLGLLLCVLVLWNWHDLSYFTSIISSYYAKEFCSCYFVTGESEAFCHDYTRQYIPISSFSLDKEKKTVTVTGLLRKSEAYYTGPRTGCALR
jgi:hypothetical protein